VSPPAGGGGWVWPNPLENFSTPIFFWVSPPHGGYPRLPNGCVLAGPPPDLKKKPDPGGGMNVDKGGAVVGCGGHSDRGRFGYKLGMPSKVKKIIFWTKYIWIIFFFPKHVITTQRESHPDRERP